MRKLSWMILPVLMLCGVLSVAAQDAERDAGKSDSTAKTDEKNDSAEANEDGESEDSEAEEEAPATATLDKKAPDFTLKNANGTEVKLSDYKDKIVVLEWINFDCPWCKMHYEDSDALVKMHKEMRDAGGTTIAQDEASCVVFGMPREAIRHGGAEQVISLLQIPAALLAFGRRGAALGVP